MFDQLKTGVSTQFKKLSSEQLFQVVVDRDEIFQTYLNAFPEAHRQEHNCNCCKSFIRQFGGIITLTDNKITTIWDFEIGGIYQPVVNAMAALIKSSPIDSIFVSHEKLLGTDHSIQRKEGETIRWNHLCAILPSNKITPAYESLDSIRGSSRSARQVFKRALDEITQDSLSVVLELIAQKSLYRGDEFKALLIKFQKQKRIYDSLNPEQREYFSWANYQSSPPIRNTSIGTLLLDLSEGKDLDIAVSAFERMVAPTNYKRPTALITSQMIQSAEKLIKELGFETALQRRHANYDDIDVNDFLYVNRTVAAKRDNIFDNLKKDVKVNPAKLTKMETVSAETFINEILPTVDEVEILFEKKILNNLVSLIAPADPDAKNILKWTNGISWDYVGGLADSLKERVKNAGGNINGFLRISLGWFNTDDLDLHVVEPNNFEIYYGRRISPSSGTLDVDMNVSSYDARTDAVENIVYTRPEAMNEGIYRVVVNNYACRNSSNAGFNVEIETVDGLYSFSSDKNPRQKGDITVATFHYSKKNGITDVMGDVNVVSNSTAIQKWNIETNKFHKVSSIMYSPNYWGDEGIGNKHLFFVINDAKNPDPARGLFNEMLSNEVYTHKKVFEVLGQKLTVPYSDQQLSGLGFTFTQRSEVILKLHSKFDRLIKVQF